VVGAILTVAKNIQLRFTEEGYLNYSGAGEDI
jgi:hypothetical protein